jgi:hypothetical protein
MEAAIPNPNPERAASSGRGPVLDVITAAMAAMATMTHANAVTWFMWEPDMNTAKGANAKVSVAASATPRRGSVIRS